MAVWKRKMDLQLFAEPEGTHVEGDPKGSGNGGDPGEDGKTYTKAEVLELIQKESDRRVSAALKKQAKDYDKKLSLSGLDEQEREKAQKDMRIQELEDQLREMRVIGNKNELIKVLNSRGLNAEFADLIEITDDAEESQKKIERLDKLFKAAVEAEVKKRLSGGAPKAGAGGTGKVTKEQFAKMDIAKRQQLFKADPALFKELANS